MAESAGVGGTPQGLVEQIAAALRQAPFEVQQAGALFLRATAEKAIRQALGEFGVAGKGALIAVTGRDGPQLRPASFLGARFAPDLVVDVPAIGRVAVIITLLRGDASPVTSTLAHALVLATSPRYWAVVALVLDRRVGSPFPEAEQALAVAAEPASEGVKLSVAEETLLEQLWQHHRVWVEVRRQDPFGWG